jgi:co-chaperonin GroES (HSP10)
MLKPILHRVIVRPDAVEKVSPGGIVIAIDEKKERAAVETGVVQSVGDTAFKEFEATVIPAVGERVYYAKYAGKKIKDSDNTEFVILNDEDIVAIIE